MNRYFTTEWKEKVDILEHIQDTLRKHPNCTVYIGTDSQDAYERGMSCYATCIVFRYATRGAHYIYLKENVARNRDDYMRLYEEANRTINTAIYIQENIPSLKLILEFDYADIKKTLSSLLVGAVKGYVSGLGFEPVFKSGQMIASKAADHICRSRN